MDTGATRRRRRRQLAIALLAAALAAGNVLAACHAHAFVTYADLPPGTAPTATPAKLGAWARLRTLLVGVRNPRPRVEADPASVGLAFETVALVASDGTRLEAWRVPAPGARAVVVCVPGYAASRSSLLARAVEWSRLGCEPWLLDPRGVGGSEGRTTSLGIDEALDVTACVARARVPGRPLVVDGLSQGGAAALRAARAGASLDALFLESVFDRLSTTVGHRCEAMGLPGRAGAALLLAWGSLLLGRDAFAHAPVEDAAHVRVPVVVVSGADDPWVRPAEARALADAARCELALVAGSGHAEALGRDPAVWRGAAARLVERVAR